MEYVNFGKHETKISRLGFGAWGIGKQMWQGVEDDESMKALKLAIKNGITIFDSALVYGSGHSERMLGRIERESGKKLFLTSKIPSKKFEWPVKDNSTLEESFPAEYIIMKTEQSLRNFNRDHIDLMQFHVWNDKWADNDEWKEAVLKLKEQGKVRYWGISINDHQPENGIEAGKSGLIDSFQVIFNIFDQSPLEKLLPFCEENNIAVIARVPFDEGGLTGNIKPGVEFPDGDWRNNYFKGDRKQQVWDRVQSINAIIKDECETPAEAALRFTISFDAVTTVIPGMRREKNVLANVKSAEKGALSEELIEKLKEHRWQRNFYD